MEAFKEILLLEIVKVESYSEELISVESHDIYL